MRRVSMSDALLQLCVTRCTTLDRAVARSLNRSDDASVDRDPDCSIARFIVYSAACSQNHAGERTTVCLIQHIPEELFRRFEVRTIQADLELLAGYFTLRHQSHGMFLISSNTVRHADVKGCMRHAT